MTLARRALQPAAGWADTPSMPATLTPVRPPTDSPSETAGAVAAKVHTSLEHLSDLYAYNHWIFTRIRPFLLGSICEVGGGIGNITQFLLNYPRVVSIDPEPRAYATSRRRFRDHLNVTVSQAAIEDCPIRHVGPQSFDTVICLNVLEHIRDDVAALRKMAELCRPGGKVVILVPALGVLYGRMDRSFGHFRRYNRRTLSSAFRAAGLRVVHSNYFNMLGAFGWFFKGRLAKSDQLDARSCRAFDRLVPYLDALERLLPPPFGQSLIMIGKPWAR